MADGPMPTPSPDDPNRLEDLRRDLADVSRGNAQAKQDFTDDLMVFVDAAAKPDSAPAVRELATQLADAVAAAKPKDEAIPPLLKQVWTALAARDLSERQVTQMQADVRTALTGAGIGDPAAQTITNQVGTVQKAVTNRSRRWYEVF
jgi:predicted RNA-binding Zn ribbon-like protein